MRASTAVLVTSGSSYLTMFLGVVLAWTALAVPCFTAYRLGAGIWTLWGLLLAYVVLGSSVFYLRYRSGQWESMRVIEG